MPSRIPLAGLRGAKHLLADPMHENKHNVLASMAFPQRHHVKVHSTNALEWLSKKRTLSADVFEIFLNKASSMRLKDAALFGQNDTLQTAKPRHPHHGFRTNGPSSDGIVARQCSVGRLSSHQARLEITRN